MTPEKLQSLEPLFGTWLVQAKISEGKASKFYKVSSVSAQATNYRGLKIIKFPWDDKELSRVISSGKYSNIDEYLDLLQQSVSKNMDIMLSLADSPNIVTLYDYTIIREASCFYVLMLMELLTPLGEYHSLEKLTKQDCVELGMDMCNALEAFRERGIIHHDVTPENIYVDIHGRYKLGDVGRYDYDGSISEASVYMAPELYHKNFERDRSSDIYSLGMVLYKLLNNNRLPFLPAYPSPVSLSDREQCFMKCMAGESFPSPVNADFNLSKIILTAAAFKAEERYFSPSVMWDHLNRYLSFSQIPAAPAPVTAPQEGFEISQEKDIHFDTYEYPDDEFDEDDYTETTQEEEEQPKKRWYFLVFGLLIILGLIIALISGLGPDDDKDKTTAPPPTTTTTLPSQTTTNVTTTEETTTEETTTEETTTEETTTEETTTEETTTEETTTEETTTEETTEETTTEPTTQPTLVSTNRKNGDKSTDGKTYLRISSYKVVEAPEDEFFREVVLSIGDNLGENLMGTKAYVYQMSGSSLIQKVTANVSLENDEEAGDIICTITVEDSDFYYEADSFQYYLCLEEGAIVSDTVITLPLQIRI